MHNFSAGPGALPDAVLAEAARAVDELPGTGLSILGLSHRSERFERMVHETEENFRALLGVDRRYRVLLLQGGGSLQFAMVPMHLLRGRDRPAEYVVGGYWSARSVAEARLHGEVRVLWSGEADGYQRLTSARELRPSADAAYLHYVSNETVEGLQFHDVPGHDLVPRVCDMSSDFCSRPHAMERYDLVYAHAQKNLGPAGVTVVVLHEKLLDDEHEGLPAMLRYRTHAEHGSIYNTPPVFSIYVTLLVTRWLRDDIGGLRAMADLNARKAAMLYDLLDGDPDFFRVRPERASRSQMNVVFRLPSPALDEALIAGAEARGLHGLRGHRSIGGLRVSLYNAVPLAAVAALCEHLADFRRAH